MAKAWDAWLPDVLPHVAGCPDILATHETKRAAQAFFRDSLVWRVTPDPVDVDVDEPEMRIYPDASGTEIVRIEQAAIGAAKLKPLSLDAIAAEFGPDWAAQTGTPDAIFGPTPTTVRLVPYPVVALTEQLSLVVSLTPGETASGIPDELYARYRETITDGAKSRLMLIPGQTWTNLDMGAALAARFESGISTARTDAARAHGRATPRARASFC